MISTESLDLIVLLHPQPPFRFHQPKQKLAEVLNVDIAPMTQARADLQALLLLLRHLGQVWDLEFASR